MFLVKTSLQLTSKEILISLGSNMTQPQTVCSPVHMILLDNQQLNIPNKQICRIQCARRSYICGKTIGWHANKLKSNAINLFSFQIFIQSWHNTAIKCGPAWNMILRNNQFQKYLKTLSNEILR